MWYIFRQYEPNGRGFFERVEQHIGYPPCNTVLEVYIGPYSSKEQAEKAIENVKYRK